MAYASRKFRQLPLLNENGRWLMRFRGKRIEFVNFQSALREAILEAYEHSKNGTPTQVVCIDEQLALEIMWTYGVDPDPPAALAGASERKHSAGGSSHGPLRPACMPAH